MPLIMHNTLKAIIIITVLGERERHVRGLREIEEKGKRKTSNENHK